MALFATLDDLTTELREMGTHSAEYWDKQVHAVAPSITVDRIDFLTKLCTGKTVLHVGCTGALDQALCKVAAACYGIDKGPSDRPNYQDLDLDRLDGTFPAVVGIDLIVCGEVLEHLSNPGRFLDALRTTYNTVPLVITVPNAFCEAGQSWLVTRHRENVHRDHVAYYSVTTLTTLLKRAQYSVTKHYWYGGKPYVSEGLIVLATPTKD
ncbi:MAG: class I SAM-dependent methyltransferase [Alphaproteobacteria bacterium]